MVLFLFLTHLGLGIIFTLVLVSREAGVKFFRFNAGMAAILMAAAFAVRPSELEPSAATTTGLAALAVAEAAIVIYWASVGRALASIRPALVVIACGGGLVALTAQAIATTAVGGFTVLTLASFLSSTALLGGASTAMILGHWYLILPSMQVSHLQAIVKVHIAVIVEAHGFQCHEENTQHQRHRRGAREEVAFHADNLIEQREQVFNLPDVIGQPR